MPARLERGLVPPQRSARATSPKTGHYFHPVGGGEHWIVALYGMIGDYPPHDEEGFMEFVRSLPTPKPYEVLRQFSPVTPIVGNRRVENRMRHYNEMEHYLENFLVTGDAAVAFNPMFAQGMSVAAMEALVLGECLRQQAQDEGLAKCFQKRLAQLVAFPLQLASSSDLEWFPSENRVSDPEKVLMGRYINQVMRAANRNPQVLETFLHVQHLLEPPSTFFRPDIVLQVMKEMDSTIDH